VRTALLALIVGSLAACSSVTLSPPSGALPPTEPAPQEAPRPEKPSPTTAGLGPQALAAWQWADSQPLPPPLVRAKSVWSPVRWSDLPGWGNDALHEAWNAWLRGCERPPAVLAPLCPEVRQLSLADSDERHEWVMRRLQPYQVQAPGGGARGTLTGYYEPMLQASRTPSGNFQIPLHRPPASLRNGQPWFSRQEIATLPQAQGELRGQEIAWLEDPIDALLLHIQGSGRLQLIDGAGASQWVRVAFAGTNNQPYRSVNQWLAQQGAPTAPWPDAARAWVRQNPDKAGPLLWSNPRYVFFREEPLNGLDAQSGPRGAQGVALTPGRSIAVDRDSIPYGTPLWLRSVGPVARLERLVLAQDTGTAIVGPVRADYFAGWGPEAFTLAAGLKQPLELWALWPRNP
jgi:membrane-bound lytic murein transglycosylase A